MISYLCGWTAVAIYLNNMKKKVVGKENWQKNFTLFGVRQYNEKTCEKVYKPEHGV